MTEFEVTLLSLGGAVLVIAAYGIFVYWNRYVKESKKVVWKERLSPFISGKSATEKTPLSLLKEEAQPETYFKSKLPKVEGLKEWIQHSGLDISPVFLITTSASIGIIVCLAFIFALRANLLFSLLLGMFSSFFLPWAVISLLTARRKSQFFEDFPVALDIIRRALRAGHSADRALEMAGEHAAGPVGEMFRVITDKMRLGEPPETALGEMANRIGIDDFRMLAIVLVLQRETGGSLAEAVENFAKIIRARQNLRKKIKALSAEVRVTAAILTAIPFFILGAIYTTSPKYLDPLLYTEDGQILLIIGGLMLFGGITIIIRMAYKDIY